VVERYGFLDYQGEDWSPWYRPPGGKFWFYAERGDNRSRETVLVKVVAPQDTAPVQVHAYGSGQRAHSAGHSSLATTQATHVAELVREECSADALAT
jgi:hypothetical protein